MNSARIASLALLFAASCASGQQKPDDKSAIDGTPAAGQSPAEAADEADFKKAQQLSKDGKLNDAQAALSEILEKHPTSRFKQEAAVELGLVQARLGKRQDAEQTLKPALVGMTPEQRKQANDALALAVVQGGGAEAAAAARALNDASDGERQKKLEEYVAALDRTPAPALARLAGELEHKSPAWAPAAVKLARVQIHLGDRSHAAQMLDEVAAQDGKTAAHDAARALRDDLKRSAAVNPKLIGIVLPLSGKFKAFAESMLDAISLQIDLQNRGPLQVLIKDSKNEPDGAQLAVEELAREGAIAIIGPIGLAEGTAAAVRAQQLGVPIISLARAEGLTQLGPYVFRDMATSSAQARAVAKYAMEKLSAKTFAVLQPESPTGEDLGRFFWDAAEAGGAEMRGFEKYPDRSTNFKRTMQRLVGRDNLAERREFVEEEARIAQEITDPYRKRKALAQLRNAAAPIIDFDALFIPDFASSIRLMAPALAAEDIVTNGCDLKDVEIARKTTKKEDLRTVQLLGWAGWDSAELVDERLGAARYVQCSIFVDGFFNKSTRPATAKFVETFETAFKRPPLLLEAHAHDAAGLLKMVIESKKPATRDDLRNALANMQKPFEGATGDTTFDQEREPRRQLFWLWINKGNILEFDPAGTPPVPLVPSAQAAIDAEKKDDGKGR